MRCEPGPMAVAIEGMPVVYLTDRQDAPRRGGVCMSAVIRPCVLE